jgi:hypothetical protein
MEVRIGNLGCPDFSKLVVVVSELVGYVVSPLEHSFPVSAGLKQDPYELSEKPFYPLR